MKNFASALPAGLTILLLAGCGGTVPTTEKTSSAAAAPAGFDTSPEGPAVEGVKVTGNGATVGAGRGQDVFAVRFPAGNGKPAALFSFKETDINDRLGLALDIRNPGRQAVRIFADLNQDTWVRGYVTVAPGATGTLHVFARRKSLADAAKQKFPGMHGLPGGKMSLWAGIEEPIVAREVKVFMVMPPADAAIEVGNIRPFGSSLTPNFAGFFPFIDRYGQYKHKEWPGKVHADADFAINRTREDADLAAHPGPRGLDQYGGWSAGPQLKATGSFRVEKYQGKWWLVDPEGRLFWSHGVGVVGFNLSSTRIQGRESFYEDPAPDGKFLERNLQTKYGAKWSEVARDRIVQRLRSWGLNTLGGSSEPAIIDWRRIPYTVTIWTARRNSAPIDPDSPVWAAKMRSVLTEAAATAKNDPWCVGFFVDNEIHASTDPAWFERYYRQVAAVAREVMPDKLYLGSRLDYHDWPDEPENRKEIVRIAAKYCDVISFNFYKFTVDDVALPDGIDRPAIIGEFHIGALDRGLFHTGLRSVLDQNQRAEAYRYYVTSALRNPAIVGAHWFQFYDESTTGRGDGENYQIGFLDICDTPYAETIAAAREMGAKLYATRAATK